jgi:hypothetical protein
MLFGDKGDRSIMHSRCVAGTNLLYGVSAIQSSGRTRSLRHDYHMHMGTRRRTILPGSDPVMADVARPMDLRNICFSGCAGVRRFTTTAICGTTSKIYEKCFATDYREKHWGAGAAGILRVGAINSCPLVGELAACGHGFGATLYGIFVYITPVHQNLFPAQKFTPSQFMITRVPQDVFFGMNETYYLRCLLHWYCCYWLVRCSEVRDGRSK